MTRLREDWLVELRTELAPYFTRLDYHLPDKIRLSCGFPRGQRKHVGQCWSQSCSADDTHEIFVSPSMADAIEVAGIIVHELCHAAVGVETGHKGPFKKCAKAIGLEGKMTATTTGDDLLATLKTICARLGPYPHASLNPLDTKKQTTRMCKIECPACGYTARTTRKWLDVGTPTCVCGEQMIGIVSE